MKTKLSLLILVTQAVAGFNPLRAADRYWVHQPVYENYFSSSADLSDWQLIEDDGTGGFTLSGNASAILKMDDAAGAFANRLFNKNGAAGRLLPFDAVNGRVELLVKSITGGNQRIFLQAQEFNSSGTYLGQVNILPARSATGFFSVNLSSVTWAPGTQQVRFIIGGENYSGNQGTVEFGYFSYSNTNNNWSNSANWSATSGGPGGASVPGASDNVIFDGAANSNGSSLLDINSSIYSLQTTGGYSGNIDLQSYQLTIGAGGVAIAGGGITGSSQNIQINGNMSISAGAFTNPSGNTYVTGDVAITGGVLNFSAGKVIFNGSTDQQFSASVITLINNLTIDKPSGVINFGSDILVSGALTLNQGVLNMNGNTIRLGTSSGNIGTLAVSNGRINGNFARWLSTTGTGAMVFPLGNALTAGNLTLNVVAAPSVGGIVTAAFTDATPGFTPASFADGASTIVQVSAARWNVGVSGLSGGNYSLSVSSTNLGTINSLSDLHLTQTGGAVGTHQSATGTLSVPVLNRSGLNSANLTQTYYASLSSITLPVTWLDFAVSNRGAMITWNWTLALEDNVAWYEPQYSTDGIQFTTAGKVAGLRADHSYSFTSSLPQNGSVLCRVKEVDKDSKSSYSIVRALSVTGKIEFSFYPNPVRDEVTVVWPYNNGNAIHTIITNSQGQIVLDQLNPGAGTLHFSLKGLAAGSYYISCRDSKQGKMETRMLIKMKE